MEQDIITKDNSNESPVGRPTQWHLLSRSIRHLISTSETNI